MKPFFDTINYTQMKPGTAWGVVIRKCGRCRRLGKVENHGMMTHSVKLSRVSKKLNQLEQCIEKDALD